MGLSAATFLVVSFPLRILCCLSVTIAAAGLAFYLCHLKWWGPCRCAGVCASDAQQLSLQLVLKSHTLKFLSHFTIQNYLNKLGRKKKISSDVEVQAVRYSGWDCCQSLSVSLLHGLGSDLCGRVAAHLVTKDARAPGCHHITNDKDVLFSIIWCKSFNLFYLFPFCSRSTTAACALFVLCSHLEGLLPIPTNFTLLTRNHKTAAKYKLCWPLVAITRLQCCGNVFTNSGVLFWCCYAGGVIFGGEERTD